MTVYLTQELFGPFGSGFSVSESSHGSENVGLLPKLSTKPFFVFLYPIQRASMTDFICFVLRTSESSALLEKVAKSQPRPKWIRHSFRASGMKFEAYLAYYSA